MKTAVNHSLPVSWETLIDKNEEVYSAKLWNFDIHWQQFIDALFFKEKNLFMVSNVIKLGAL